MTDITFFKNRDTFFFDSRGHTGYAEGGLDVLCSAVSILCYTLAAALAKYEEEGKIVNFRKRIASGEVHLEFSAEYLPEGIKTLMLGFGLLNENFPEYITADIEL